MELPDNHPGEYRAGTGPCYKVVLFIFVDISYLLQSDCKGTKAGWKLPNLQVNALEDNNQRN